MILLGFGAGIAFNPVLLAAMSDVAPRGVRARVGRRQHVVHDGRRARPRRARQPRRLAHGHPERVRRERARGAQRRLPRSRSSSARSSPGRGGRRRPLFRAAARRRRPRTTGGEQHAGARAIAEADVTVSARIEERREPRAHRCGDRVQVRPERVIAAHDGDRAALGGAAASRTGRARPGRRASGLRRRRAPAARLGAGGGPGAAGGWSGNARQSTAAAPVSRPRCGRRPGRRRSARRPRRAAAEAGQRAGASTTATQAASSCARARRSVGRRRGTAARRARWSGRATVRGLRGGDEIPRARRRRPRRGRGRGHRERHGHDARGRAPVRGASRSPPGPRRGHGDRFPERVPSAATAAPRALSIARAVAFVVRLRERGAPATVRDERRATWQGSPFTSRSPRADAGKASEFWGSLFGWQFAGVRGARRRTS